MTRDLYTCISGCLLFVLFATTSDAAEVTASDVISNAEKYTHYEDVFVYNVLPKKYDDVKPMDVVSVSEEIATRLEETPNDKNWAELFHFCKEACRKHEGCKSVEVDLKEPECRLFDALCPDGDSMIESDSTLIFFKPDGKEPAAESAPGFDFYSREVPKGGSSRVVKIKGDGRCKSETPLADRVGKCAKACKKQKGCIAFQYIAASVTGGGKCTIFTDTSDVEFDGFASLTGAFYFSKEAKACKDAEEPSYFGFASGDEGAYNFKCEPFIKEGQWCSGLAGSTGDLTYGNKGCEPGTTCTVDKSQDDGDDYCVRQ